VSWAFEDPVGKADVECCIRPKHLRLTLRGAVVCDGALLHEVDPAESFWHLEGKAGDCYCRLVVSLVKQCAPRSWARLWMDEPAGVAETTAEAGPEGEPGLGLFNFSGSCVIGSDDDNGDIGNQELITKQEESEQRLEPLYNQLVTQNGVDHEETLKVFFQLYNEKIQLYRLNELEGYLRDIVPACRKRGGPFRVQGIQALCFLRFKQKRHGEALELLLEIEEALGQKHPDVSENIAMCHLHLGDLEASEERLREVLKLRTGGSTLLALGHVYKLRNEHQRARPLVQQAYDLYSESARGRPSSLQAKAGVQLATILSYLDDRARAEELYREALSMYEVTCGAGSPLAATACRHLGLLLLAEGRRREARPHLRRAYEVAVAQDAFDLEDIMNLHCQLMSAHRVEGKVVDQHEFRQYLPTIDAALERAPPESQHRPYYAMFAGEVKVWTADHGAARALLSGSLSALKARSPQDDQENSRHAKAITHIEGLMGICDRHLPGCGQPSS